MSTVDLLLHSAAQLVTCASPNGPKRGAAMADVGLIEDGAIAISDGAIVAVGPTADVRADHAARQTIDARGKVICPGFVDCHTHAVWAGDRAHEFEMRLRGASYMEILAAGGGILNTMRATRAASEEELTQRARERLQTMLRLGSTTVEIKTGYGLETETELKLLRVIERLAADFPGAVVPTFLGAHAIPPEYQGNTDAYVNLVIEGMIPAAAKWYHNSSLATRLSRLAPRNSQFSIDVFCEEGVFDLEQTRRILEAGRAHDMALKLHVDEFVNLGGVTLGVELGAVSVDHLDVTPAEEIELLAASETVGVALPAVNFHLVTGGYADYRRMVDAGVALALATDLNPGSAPCPSMPLVMALACRYGGLSPAEALVASTINAAHALGLGEQIGSLEVGKRADLLVLDAPDYRHLAYRFGENLVEQVIVGGGLVGGKG